MIRWSIGIWLVCRTIRSGSWTDNRTQEWRPNPGKQSALRYGPKKANLEQLEIVVFLWFGVINAGSRITFTAPEGEAAWLGKKSRAFFYCTTFSSLRIIIRRLQSLPRLHLRTYRKEISFLRRRCVYSTDSLRNAGSLLYHCHEVPRTFPAKFGMFITVVEATFLNNKKGILLWTILP